MMEAKRRKSETKEKSQVSIMTIPGGDMQPILEVNYASGLLPLNVQATSGVERFPLVIWDKLASSLELQDIHNLLRGTNLPKTVIRNCTWMNILFPQVFPILVNCQPPSGKDLLNTRAVCKSWKNFVDSQIQMDINSPFQTMTTFSEDGNWEVLDRNPPNFSRLRANPCKSAYRFRHSRQIETFLERFSTYANASPELARNPFISQSLNLIVWENRATLVPAISNLVSTYGLHITNLQVSFSSDDGDGDNLAMGVEIYSNLRAWLASLPNLKLLRLHALRWTRNLWMWRFWQHLENQVQRNPLPQLGQLTSFYAGDLPTPVIREVLRRAGLNLEKLRIEFSNGYWDVEANPGLTSHGIPTMNKLTEMKIVTVIGPMANQFITSKLQNCLQCPALQKLCLTYTEYEGWNEVCTLLNNFGSSLTHLILQLAHQTNYEYSDFMKIESRLCLPYLKEMRFTSPSLAPLDILLDAKNLECLAISMSYKNNNVPWPLLHAESIQFNDNYHHRMEDSNIWEHFPFFKELHLELTARPEVYNPKGSNIDRKTNYKFRPGKYHFKRSSK